MKTVFLRSVWSCSRNGVPHIVADHSQAPLNGVACGNGNFLVNGFVFSNIGGWIEVNDSTRDRLRTTEISTGNRRIGMNTDRRNDDGVALRRSDSVAGRTH